MKIKRVWIILFVFIMLIKLISFVEAGASLGECGQYECLVYTCNEFGWGPLPGDDLVGCSESATFCDGNKIKRTAYGSTNNQCGYSSTQARYACTSECPGYGATCTYTVQTCNGAHQTCGGSPASCVDIPAECSLGAEKCEGNIYYDCTDKNKYWAYKGLVNGKCNYFEKSCSDPSQTILKLSNSNNAFGGLWNDTLSKYDICYNDLFGTNYTGLNPPHNCTKTNNILNLSAITGGNGSVLGDYNNKICYGNLVCRAINSSLMAYYNFEDINPYDSFDIIDNSKWVQLNSSNPAVIEGGKLKSIGSSGDIGNSTSGINSAGKWKLKGNFDVQIDYDSTIMPDTTGITNAAAITTLSVFGNTYFYMLMNSKGNNNVFTSFSWTNQGSTIWNSGTITPVTSGKYRLKRTGNVLKGYQWESNDWKEIASIANCDTSDMSVRAYVYNNNGAGNTNGIIPQAYFDNLIVKNGYSVKDSLGINNGVGSEAVYLTGKTGFGQAIKFDGINSSVSIPASGSLNLPNAWTLSAWVNVDLIQNTAGHIVAKRDTASTNYAFRTNGFGNSWDCYFYNGAWKGVWNVGTVHKGEWHYMTCTYDGIGTMKVYEDGNLIATNSTVGPAPPVNNVPVTLGAWLLTGNPVERLNGSIDELKIWKRALSLSEIQQEYALTSPTINANDSCSAEEILTLRLSNFTNALMSNVSNNNFSIQICCKNEIPGSYDWTNMKNQMIINASLKDSVKLMINREGIQNKKVNYTVYKQGPTILTFRLDNAIVQDSTSGYLVWQAGLNSTGGYSPGNYYFIAEVEGDPVTKTSGILTVSALQNDSKPTITLVKPFAERTFIINNTGRTALIIFEQISSDEDDDLNVTWDFRDGNSSTFSNCVTTGNCNTTYSYTLSGTKMVKATATEMLRNNSAYNLSRIYVYKKGLNIFAIIDSPLYNKSISTIGTYLLNGTSSYVANCSFNRDECDGAAPPPTNLL